MNKLNTNQEKMSSIIIILGYKNESDGTLHPISQQRANKAFAVAQEFSSRSQAVKLLCTGGFGDAFNQTDTSHGSIVQTYLEDLGLHKQLFLPIAASQNTYEDGKLCAELLHDMTVNNLILVTSDFHIQRGFLWLNHFSPKGSITCEPAITKTDKPKLTSLLAHEKRAITLFYQDFPATQPLEQLYDWHSLDLPFLAQLT